MLGKWGVRFNGGVKMHSAHWQDVLTLFCMTILADEKVYQEEVEAFIEAGLALKARLSPKIMLTRHMMVDWFKLYREDLGEIMKGPERSVVIQNCLDNLQDVPERSEIATSLIEIARSDGYKHRNEINIIHLAHNAWGLTLPLAS